MPDVLILVGSESDKPRIEPAFDVLSKAGVSYEFHVSSAHRQPEQTAKLVSGSRSRTPSVSPATPMPTPSLMRSPMPCLVPLGSGTSAPCFLIPSPAGKAPTR